MLCARFPGGWREEIWGLQLEVTSASGSPQWFLPLLYRAAACALPSDSAHAAFPEEPFIMTHNTNKGVQNWWNQNNVCWLHSCLFPGWLLSVSWLWQCPIVMKDIYVAGEKQVTGIWKLMDHFCSFPWICNHFKIKGHVIPISSLAVFWYNSKTTAMRLQLILLFWSSEIISRNGAISWENREW